MTKMHKILPGQKEINFKNLWHPNMSELFSLTPQTICVPHYGPWRLMSVSTFIGQPRISKHSISSHFLNLSWLFILSPVVLWVVFLSWFWKCWKVVMDRLLSASPSSHFDVCYCVPVHLLFPLQSSWASPSMELWLSNHCMHQWQQFLWTRNSNSEPLWNLGALLMSGTWSPLEILSSTNKEKNCRGTKISCCWDTFEKLFLILLDYEN